MKPLDRILTAALLTCMVLLFVSLGGCTTTVSRTFVVPPSPSQPSQPRYGGTLCYAVSCRPFVEHIA